LFCFYFYIHILVLFQLIHFGLFNSFVLFSHIFGSGNALAKRTSEFRCLISAASSSPSTIRLGELSNLNCYYRIIPNFKEFENTLICTVINIDNYTL